LEILIIDHEAGGACFVKAGEGQRGDPLVSARARAGLEGEALLCEGLRGRGIAFWPEQQLRAEGFFKTPDVKLQARRPRLQTPDAARAPPRPRHKMTPHACLGMSGNTLHAGLLTEALCLLSGLLVLVSPTMRVCCISSSDDPLAPGCAPHLHARACAGADHGARARRQLD